MNGLLILAAFVLYGLLVYGPRLIGRKRKIIGKLYRRVSRFLWRRRQRDMVFNFDTPPELYIRDPALIKRIHSFDGGDTLREVNARRGK